MCWCFIHYLENNFSNGKKYVCIPPSFLVINVCNQGKTLCSSCITISSILAYESQTLYLLLTKEQRRGAFKESEVEKNSDGKEKQEAENKIKPSERGLSGQSL